MSYVSCNRQSLVTDASVRRPKHAAPYDRRCFRGEKSPQLDVIRYIRVNTTRQQWLTECLGNKPPLLYDV